MSGISTRIDKGQTRFAPKLKARPNRNKTTASEDSTPAPTPQIGSTASDAESFASLLLEPDTSSPILSPASSYTTAIVAPLTPAATQPDKIALSSRPGITLAASSQSAASISSPSSEHHIQRFGERISIHSALSEESAADSRSVIPSPTSAKGGSIISVPSTRTHAERDDDGENGDAASSSNRKRVRGKAVATVRSRQHQFDENEGVQFIDEQGQEGQGEVEEGDPEFPDYSNTPMYEFVKDMGVGRRSAVFLERQKQIDEQRRLAKIEKREMSQRASQTPGPGENIDENEDEGAHDDLPSRQGTPSVEDKKTKREPSLSTPTTRTFAPQVRLVDGRIELDIDSLTVDHATVDAGNQGPMEYVEESSTTRFTNSASFSTGNKGEKWSDEDTELFYRALAQWGTDFGIIHKMFNKKSRINVRNKFKREDRLNHSRVQQALNNRAPMDLEEYSALTAKEFPEIDDVEETIKKMHEEELEKRAEAALLEGGGEYEEYDGYQGEEEAAAEEEVVDDGGEEIVGEVGDIP